MTRIGKKQGTFEPNRYFSSKIDPKTGKRKVRKLTKGQQSAKAIIEKQNQYHSSPAPILNFQQEASKPTIQKLPFIATEEQVEARNQRREAQKAYSSNRKYSRQGNRTVKNPTTGMFEAMVNTDAQYARNIENYVRTSYEEMKSLHPNRLSPLNNILQEQEARANAAAQPNPQPTAGPQPTNKPQKLSVAERLKNASPEVQQRYASRFGKGGFLSKLGKAGGKALLAAGVAYGLYKLGSAIFGGNDKKTENIKEEQKIDKKPETPVVAADTTAKKEAANDGKTEKTDSTVTVPLTDAKKDEKADETKEKQKTEKAKESNGFEVDENGAYTVKKGDCIWNIAKAYLVTSGQDSSDRAISAQVNKIMEANPNLKWKAKGDIEKYFVDILVGNKIIIPDAKKTENADKAEKADDAKKAEEAKDTLETKKADDAKKAEEVKDTLETAA